MSEETHQPPAGPTSVATRRLIAVGASLLTLGSIAFAIQFYRNVLGLLLFNEQFLAGMLALGMAMVYLTQPIRPGMHRPTVPWYDWLLAAASLFVGFYVAVRFPALSEQVVERPMDGLIVAFITVPLVVEGLRRTVGLALTIVVIVFLAYALVGHLVPGALAGRPVKITQLTFYLVWDAGSLLGLPLLVATTIVIAFVFFGGLLFASGGSAFFTDIALTLMGRYRGGSAKIAVTASCLFGMISGSAVSNVASVGVLTIPLMRRGGYPAHVAAAIEAVWRAADLWCRRRSGRASARGCWTSCCPGRFRRSAASTTGRKACACAARCRCRLSRRTNSGKSVHHAERVHVGVEHFLLLAAFVGVELAQAHDRAQRLDVEAVALGLGIDVADVVGGRLLLLLEPLDALDDGFELILGEAGGGLFFFGCGAGGHRSLLKLSFKRAFGVARPQVKPRPPSSTLFTALIYFRATSAFPAKADFLSVSCIAAFGPQADSCTAAKWHRYSAPVIASQPNGFGNCLGTACQLPGSFLVLCHR